MYVLLVFHVNHLSNFLFQFFLNFAGIFIRGSLISRFFYNREKREIKYPRNEVPIKYLVDVKI